MTRTEVLMVLGASLSVGFKLNWNLSHFFRHEACPGPALSRPGGLRDGLRPRALEEDGRQPRGHSHPVAHIDMICIVG